MSRSIRPYARAFLEAAPKGYDVERFLSAAGDLERAIEGNPRLKAFLTAPSIPVTAKTQALEEISRRAGLDEFGRRFFDVVLKNRRLLEVEEILRALRLAWDESRGVVVARVTVASPVGEAEKKTIEEALSGKVGRTVQAKVVVDPSILAGFVARVRSEVFDASATTAIRRFQERAKGRTGA